MPSRIKPIFICLALLFASLSNLHAADIYQWTDENGKVHFSDKPPRDQKAKNISGSTKNINTESRGSEGEKLGKIFAPMTEEEKAYNQQQEQMAAQRQAALQRNCDKARKELTFFTNRRFFWVDDEGNEWNATEEERQEKIKEFSEYIAKNCQ